MKYTVEWVGLDIHNPENLWGYVYNRPIGQRDYCTVFWGKINGAILFKKVEYNVAFRRDRFKKIRKYLSTDKFTNLIESEYGQYEIVNRLRNE
jgi:hypothetical protein